MATGWDDALDELGAASDDDTGWAGTLGELLRGAGGADSGAADGDWQDLLEELQGDVSEAEEPIASAAVEVAAVELSGSALAAGAEEMVAAEYHDPHAHGLGGFLLGAKAAVQVKGIRNAIAAACTSAIQKISSANCIAAGGRSDSAICGAAPKGVIEAGSSGSAAASIPPSHGSASRSPEEVVAVVDEGAARHAQVAAAAQDLGLAVERAAAALGPGTSFPQLAEDDADRQRMVEEWFDATVSRVSSQAAESDRHGVPSKIAASYKTATAAALWCLCRRDLRTMLSHVCSEVSAKGGELLVWTEKLSFDEATMPLRVFDDEVVNSAGHGRAVDESGTQPGRVITTRVSQAAPSKIMQSARWYGCLFRVAGVYLHLQMEVVVPLQIMAAGKADVYYRCIAASCYGLGDIANRFKRKQRLAITDGDGAVALALRAISKATGIVNYHSVCDIHKNANGTTRVMAPVDDSTISKLIHLAKSLQSANAMKMFRDCLRKLVSERLEYTRCKPRMADLERTIALMDLYLPATSNTNKMKRSILLTMLNGDWFEMGVVQHRCQGCCASKEACIEKLVSFVVTVFAGAAPGVWPRSRWTGSRESINWVLLLASCHGLLKDCYLEWASQQRGGDWIGGAARGVAPGGAMAIDDAHDEVAAGDGGANTAGQAAGPAVDDKALLRARQEEQSQFRRSVSEWLLRDEARPILPELILTRLALGPMAAVNEGYLAQSGTAWDRKQWALAAAAASGHDGSVADEWGHRAYRAQLKMDGEITQRAWADWRSIMTDPQRWCVLPAQFKTVGFQTRAAAMLSQVGCEIFILRSENGNCPMLLFAALELPDEEIGGFIGDIERCRLDPWSAALIDSYEQREGTWDDWAHDFRADLWHSALLQEYDNASREANHASIRRGIVIASTQTHCEAIPHCNATWLLRSARRISARRAQTKPRRRQHAPRRQLGKGRTRRRRRRRRSDLAALGGHMCGRRV